MISSKIYKWLKFNILVVTTNYFFFFILKTNYKLSNNDIIENFVHS